MRIKILSSSTAGERRQFASSYVIDDTTCIDAGSLGFAPLAEQHAVEHVLLSHCHMDHIATLPIFLDNVCAAARTPTIHGSPEVLDALRQHVFNGQLWPDIERLRHEDGSPLARLSVLRSREPLGLEKLRITPVLLTHVIPSHGFIVESADAAVAILSDTGPTEEVWSILSTLPNLQAILLECAFPNSLGWLAERARHLTPVLFAAEYAKLGREVPVLAIHLKPAHHDDIARELAALSIPQLSIAESGRTYEF